MNKHVLALSTALSILAFTPAFAQNTTTQPAVDCTQPANANDPACLKQQNNNTPSQTQGGQTTGQSATTTSGSQQQMSTGELIVPADRLNGAQVMSANDYIGKTVYDQGGNNIGDVNDLIISSDGKIQAVILGVGGFLGIGEKDVAVNTSAIQMVQDGSNSRLVVQATKEALNNAPSYDKSNRRYATSTGTGTSTEQTGSTTTAPAPATKDNKVTVDCSKPENASNAACQNKTQP